jgi:hypothetical protein
MEHLAIERAGSIYVCWNDSVFASFESNPALPFQRNQKITAAAPLFAAAQKYL